MGYFNRFLLFLYSLSVAGLSVGVIALWSGFLSDFEIDGWVHFLLSRWETLLSAVVFFLLSIHLMGASFSRGRQKEPEERKDVVIPGTAGDVLVSVEAVEHLAERSANIVHGVESSKAAVVSGFSGSSASAKVSMDVVIGQGYSAVELAEAVRSSVAQAINQVLGITGCQVNVSVSEISSTGALKRVS